MPADPASLEWVEKHRPRTLDALAGNRKAVEDLRAWARAWDEGVPAKRAVILAGEPGTGKTSAALALAAERGWNVVELNASDQRNYDVVKRVAGAGATHDTFSPTGEFLASAAGKRTLVVLDEADNLFGREDRGGMKAIVETIRQARQPIVLIANDLYQLTRGAESLKTLALTIRFQRLRKEAVAAVLREVAGAEGVEVDPGALSLLADRAGGDLRSAVKDLQALATGRARVTERDVPAMGLRDTRATVFDALGVIFKTTDAKEAKAAALDLEESPEDLILWVDENLPLEYRDPPDLVEGYAALSRADIQLGRARRRRAYSLWPYATELMTAGVAVAKARPYRSFQRYQFPRWLRILSASRGPRALRNAVAAKVGAATHSSSDLARQETVPALRTLCNADADFAVRVVRALELEEDEVEFLLGKDSPVKDRVLAALAQPPEPERPQALDEPERKPEPEPVSPSAGAQNQSRLFDF
ncbi:MAG TPA: replication factor C large subunit [Candidatus Thermoplasmatota archaeon]|nr:replication factor C large subunit [Candidatus Thermoplasmatota archaeon]